MNPRTPVGYATQATVVHVHTSIRGAVRVQSWERAPAVYNERIRLSAADQQGVKD